MRHRHGGSAARSSVGAQAQQLNTGADHERSDKPTNGGLQRSAGLRCDRTHHSAPRQGPRRVLGAPIRADNAPQDGGTMDLFRSHGTSGVSCRPWDQCSAARGKVVLSTDGQVPVRRYLPSKLSLSRWSEMGRGTVSTPDIRSAPLLRMQVTSPSIDRLLLPGSASLADQIPSGWLASVPDTTCRQFNNRQNALTVMKTETRPDWNNDTEIVRPKKSGPQGHARGNDLLASPDASHDEPFASRHRYPL